MGGVLESTRWQPIVHNVSSVVRRYSHDDDHADMEKKPTGSPCFTSPSSLPQPTTAESLTDPHPAWASTLAASTTTANPTHPPPPTHPTHLFPPSAFPQPRPRPPSPYRPRPRFLRPRMRTARAPPSTPPRSPVGLTSLRFCSCFARSIQSPRWIQTRTMRPRRAQSARSSKKRARSSHTRPPKR